MSKITITNEHNESIVGILEKKIELDVGRPRPRIVFIVHGILGHKDYLFHRVLAERLPYSSFRFDFRGNGESGGSPGYANIQEDTDDIHTVADYFENTLGYEVYAVIGHSRGSLASLKFATTRERHVPLIVNIAGRFKMRDNQMRTSRPHIGKALDEQGYFDWHVKQRDRIATIKVTMAEVEKFYLWSNEHVARMPLSTCVLSCHGLSDTTVPPYNAAMFANRIPNHTLSLIEGADHNFRGKFEELTVVVLDFFQKHEHNQYQRAISMGQGSGLIIPRWIDVDGVRNFRDIGGWPTKDKAGYIRERVVFRSANLANATPDGIERLIKLNVKAIFDFRYDREVEKNGILREIPGVSHFAYNMFEEGLKTPEDAKAHLMEYLKGEEGFANSYMFIVETNKKLIGNIFRYMSKELSPKDRSAMVVHCSAGKDRTGVFIMLLLGLCGVDDEIIAREYDLTSLGYFGFEKDLEKRAENMGLTVENLRAALSASVGGMRLCIQQLRKKYGSFEDYVRDKCGLTNEEVNLIRELMIVPIRFEERQLHRPRM